MGQHVLCIVVAITCLITISMQASTPQSDSYVAAVVEYAPVSGVTLENKEQIFMQNVANYVCFMEEAARKSADIIVFPEIGLASMGVPRNPDGTPSLAFHVPDPGSNPCDDTSSDIAQGVKELSCAARKHRLYVVVNLPEKVNCSQSACPDFPASVDAEQCPPSGAFYHNTNVVFDRTGNIVARYRKFNLFGEAGFVPTPKPEYAIFETDFGVRFGTFICFDIMFEEPAVVLVRNHSVCDFAFPTAWFSESPFLTAVQTQGAWAYSLDVNLLASGYNMPLVGSAGSGIFLGRNGTLESVMPHSTTSRLLVGTVPKVRRCRENILSKSRVRRVPGFAGVGTLEGEDYEVSGVERTPPLSAFHHIVRMRKYGHLGADVDENFEDESAPPFTHHQKYDTADDISDENCDDSKKLSEEYVLTSKVPPHIMILQQETAQNSESQNIDGEEESIEPKRSEMEIGNMEEVETTHSGWSYGDEHTEDISENKIIPASTITDQCVFSKKPQKPDLLRLYQEEREEKPEEVLEKEVPETDNAHFEIERDEGYYKLPDEKETLESAAGLGESVEETYREKDEQLSSTEELQDSDLIARTEEKTKGEDKARDGLREKPTISEQKDTADGELNATQEEIEATVKHFGWLMDDTDDVLPPHSSAEELKVPSADSDGDTKQDERAAGEEDVDDTDDILPNVHGLIMPDDDDDGGVETDISPADEGKVAQLQTKGSEAPTLADNEGPSGSKDKADRPRKCRKRSESRSGRAKTDKSRRKCKLRNKEPEPAVDANSQEKSALDSLSSKRDVQTSQDAPEVSSSETGNSQEKSVRDSVSSVGDVETPQDAPEVISTQADNLQEKSSLDRLSSKRDIETSQDVPEVISSETDNSQKKSARDSLGSKLDVETSQDVPEVISSETDNSQEKSARDSLSSKRAVETWHVSQKVISSERKRHCRNRERREGGCPPFTDGVFDDGRDTMNISGLFLKRDHLDVYKTFKLNTDSLFENSTVLLCDGTFCCNFSIVMEVNAEEGQPRYAYRLAVFDGVRTFDGVATGGLQVCGVIPCVGDDMESCGKLSLPDSAACPTVFRSISISGVFSSNHTLVTANTLVPGLAPLPADRFNMTSVPLDNGVSRVTMKTTEIALQKGLTIFTFAIHSRVYKRDGQPETTTPAPTTTTTTTRTYGC